MLSAQDPTIMSNAVWSINLAHQHIWYEKKPIEHRQPWWRHQMETFSALLAFCAGNSPVTVEFPAQRPVTWSVDVFFDLRPNKWLSKQSWGWWFETPSCPLRRHCNVSAFLWTCTFSSQDICSHRQNRLQIPYTQPALKELKQDYTVILKLTFRWARALSLFMIAPADLQGHFALTWPVTACVHRAISAHQSHLNDDISGLDDDIACLSHGIHPRPSNPGQHRLGQETKETVI